MFKNCLFIATLICFLGVFNTAFSQQAKYVASVVNFKKADDLSQKQEVGEPITYTMATKSGWWIHINTAKTEASQITFEIGTDSNNRIFWMNWKSGDPFEFDVPQNFLNVSDLYIKATVSPGGKNGWFCMMYKNNGVKHFDFDNDEDHKQSQSDTDDECR